MSYNWSFHSFDYARFQQALTHSRQAMIDAVIREMRAFDDDPKFIERHVRVGQRLVENGFSYAGCPKAELEVVDRFVFEIFHVFSQEIGFEPESPEFLSPRVTSEFPSGVEKRFFWSRPKPVPADRRAYEYLPIFTHFGRRLGEQAPSPCEYVVLDPEETRRLKGEIETFLRTPEGGQLDAFYDNAIEKDFLVPVDVAIRKGKALHAQAS